MKDATTSIPSHSDLKVSDSNCKNTSNPRNPETFRLLWPDSPDGVQVLQAAGAAEGAVALTKHSVQTRLQKLHSAHKGLALLRGRHSLEFDLLDTDAQS